MQLSLAKTHILGISWPALHGFLREHRWCRWWYKIWWKTCEWTIWPRILYSRQYSMITRLCKMYPKLSSVHIRWEKDDDGDLDIVEENSNDHEEIPSLETKNTKTSDQQIQAIWRGFCYQSIPRKIDRVWRKCCRINHGSECRATCLPPRWRLADRGQPVMTLLIAWSCWSCLINKAINDQS